MIVAFYETERGDKHEFNQQFARFGGGVTPETETRLKGLETEIKEGVASRLAKPTVSLQAGEATKEYTLSPGFYLLFTTQGLTITGYDGMYLIFGMRSGFFRIRTIFPAANTVMDIQALENGVSVTSKIPGDFYVCFLKIY